MWILTLHTRFPNFVDFVNGRKHEKQVSVPCPPLANDSHLSLARLGRVLYPAWQYTERNTQTSPWVLPTTSQRNVLTIVYNNQANVTPCLASDECRRNVTLNRRLKEMQDEDGRGNDTTILVSCRMRYTLIFSRTNRNRTHSQWISTPGVTSRSEVCSINLGYRHHPCV